MPFMLGASPIRRTTEYLKSGRIIFRETVKIFSVNFNRKGADHKGAKDFVFWHLCQIQYKNPKVQCQTFNNLTPTPFIRIYFEDAKNVLIDIGSREKEEIVDHLVNFTAVCKTEEELLSEEKIIHQSPAYFGYGAERHCICEILGQIPCSSVVKLPNSWRGRGRNLGIKRFQIPPNYMVQGLDDEEDE